MAAIKPSSAGIDIPPNESAFFEVNRDDFISNFEFLLAHSTLVPSDFFERLITRGNIIMVSVHPSPTGYFIERDAAAKATGAWFILPKGTTLHQVAVEEYGPEVTDSEGFLDWLAKDYPKTFDVALKSFEAIDDTRKEVVEVAKKAVSTGTVVAVSLGVVALALLVLVAKK